MSSPVSPNPWGKPGIAVVLGIALLILLRLLQPGGLTRFGGFGEAFENRYIEAVDSVGAYIKPGSGGYDGQFYAQIATDPTLRNPDFKDAIDEPAYRSRRMLLPLIAHFLAFGNPEASILIYCSFNIFFWFAFAWLIWNWLSVRSARSFAQWTVCVLSVGVLDSVKYSLTDLPSMFLVLLLILYAQTRPVGVAGGLLASLFLKETNMLSVVSLPKWSDHPGRLIRNSLFWIVTAIVCLCIYLPWYGYVNWRFEAFHGISTSFDWPFAAMIRGLIQAGQELASGNFDDRYLFRILGVIGFLIQLLWLSTQWKRLENPLVRLGLVYGLLFIFLGDLVWWGYWAVCRVVLPMTIAFNLLYAPKRWFWTGLILANLTVIHAVYRFL